MEKESRHEVGDMSKGGAPVEAECRFIEEQCGGDGIELVQEPLAEIEVDDKTPCLGNDPSKVLAQGLGGKGVPSNATQLKVGLDPTVAVHKRRVVPERIPETTDVEKYTGHDTAKDNLVGGDRLGKDTRHDRLSRIGGRRQLDKEGIEVTKGVHELSLGLVQSWCRGFFGVGEEVLVLHQKLPHLFPALVEDRSGKRLDVVADKLGGSCAMESTEGGHVVLKGSLEGQATQGMGQSHLDRLSGTQRGRVGGVPETSEGVVELDQGLFGNTFWRWSRAFPTTETEAFQDLVPDVDVDLIKNAAILDGRLERVDERRSLRRHGRRRGGRHPILIQMALKDFEDTAVIEGRWGLEESILSRSHEAVRGGFVT
jgi:hypothetical protein